jgi:uncharacterized SAM-binding protein YcdF (DUF218 family)
MILLLRCIKITRYLGVYRAAMNRVKKTFYYITLIIGALGVIDTIALLTYTNINFGILFPGLAGIIFILYSYLKLFVCKGRPLIKNHILRTAVISVISLAVASFILIESLILLGTASDKYKKADYLIILGAGLKGETVSLTLKARLDKGLEYLKKFPDTKVIVSGGQGYGEAITEARAMKKYLMARGIDARQIIEEDKAASTLENFKYSKALIPAGKNGKVKLIVVSSDFHMLRAKMLAKRNGFVPYGITCSTPVSVRVNSYIREYFAVIKSWVLDK